MANPFKVAFLGECMIEFSRAKDGLYRQSCAGDTFNSAAYMARQFSPDIAVSYITGLGEDIWSQRIRDTLKAENIDDDGVITVAGKSPGLYVIENDSTGERFFQYWRNDSAAKTMFKDFSAEALAKRLERFDLVYFSGISLAILDQTQRDVFFDAVSSLKGIVQFAFDPNFRSELWPDHSVCSYAFDRTAQLVNFALVTLDDHRALWPETNLDTVGQHWLDAGVEEVIVKNGSEQCLILTDSDRLSVPPQSSLQPLDTTGAGDSFAAGYLGMRLLGANPQTSARLAHDVAAQVIMHSGGVIDKLAWKRI